jgi:hypothetical protein
MKILQTKITILKKYKSIFLHFKKIVHLKIWHNNQKEITFRKNVKKSNLQKKMQKEISSAAACRPKIHQCSPILRILQKL